MQSELRNSKKTDMSLLFLILIIVASALLGLIVLIQNPKGGGLSGNIAGFSNQFMGVKQTTDVLEKGTWILAGVIVFLCLISSLLINKPATDSNMIRNINTNTGTTTTPAQQAPANNTTPLPRTTTPAAK